MKKIKFIVTLAILFIAVTGFSQTRVGATHIYPVSPFNLQEGEYARIRCTWTTTSGIELENILWVWSSADELPYYTFANDSPFTEFKSTTVTYEIWRPNADKGFYCIGSKTLPNFAGIVTFTEVGDFACLAKDN